MVRAQGLSQVTGGVDAAIARALLHHAARLTTPERAIVLRQMTEHEDHVQHRGELLHPERSHAPAR